MTENIEGSFSPEKAGTYLFQMPLRGSNMKIEAVVDNYGTALISIESFTTLLRMLGFENTDFTPAPRADAIQNVINEYLDNPSSR